ncbi:MAG: two-component system VirA-like sensor kinase [Aurantimonas endophytica]|uniref:two-component system VirA-like sensor kinase n=1 Tax=Aurantimonas endophytica TaxID=1522175 RepID=UPI003001BBED
MTKFPLFLAATTGMLVILTILLRLSMNPDDAEHQQTLEVLRSIDMSNASLQRDVIQARSAILQNYDPLVRNLATMQQSVIRLPRHAFAADTQLEQVALELISATGLAGELVERFKSRNAIMQNSQIIFNDALETLKGDLPADNGEAHIRLTGVAGSVSRFTREPSDDNRTRLNLALNRLLFPFAAELQGPITRTLTIHGRVLASALPVVDEITADLQRIPIANLVQRYQARYLDLYAEASERAALFRLILYSAAVVLAAYVTYLFLRLQQNASVLRDRLALEAAIATVSTGFIDLKLDDLCQEIKAGLSTLVGFAGIEEARLLRKQDEAAPEGSARGEREPDDVVSSSLLAIAEDWQGKREPHGGVEVPRISALPIGSVRHRLSRLGYRSWLVLPVRNGEQQFGYLSFATRSKERKWPADEVALLRTAAEIFTNALQRAHSDRERETLQTRLSEAQRLESLGTLAGGIAHEYNNMLGAILGYGELALTDLDAGSPTHRQVQQIVRAGMRAQNITDQILAFSRRRERRYRPMRMAPAVSEALDLVRASFPDTLEITTRFEEDEGVIMGDPAELQQVVVNLCVNAVHAMDRAGVVEVVLDEIAMKRGRDLSHGRLPAGRYVRLAVRDCGHGMNSQTLRRMFEPFFTTKTVGEGTGLGLSAVHGIVTAHKGALNVNSATGKGTTIEAYFPRGDVLPVEDQDAAALSQEVPRGSGQTILVVDPAEQRRMLLEEMLANLGYEAVGFEQKEAALNAVGESLDRFDLALLDEKLVGSGPQSLRRRLREMRQDLPILILAERGSGRDGGPDRLEERLEKPLRMETLALALARQIPASAAS